MRTGRVMKRGFTLIETVVTVGIVAAMAAVVIPQVARQFDAADPARIQNDLKNIQTAIESYAVNTRVMPADLDDLANLIDVAGADADSTLTPTTAPSLDGGNQASFWSGPYLDQTIVEGGAAAEDFIVTAFGAHIEDSFVCYATGNNERGVSAATSSGTTANGNIACPGSATGQTFVALQITGIACSDVAGSTFMTINEVFDGAAETTPKLNGRIRCETGTGVGLNKDIGVNVVWFLAVPLSS